MMTAVHRRHDPVSSAGQATSDQVWERLGPLLPGNGDNRGRPARDNRLFLNAVFWILRTAAPWRDPVSSTGQALPPDFGDWKNTHRTPEPRAKGLCRWQDRDVWEQLLDTVIDDPDFEWLMINVSYIKGHPHGTGAWGWNQAIGCTKGAEQQTASGSGLPWYTRTVGPDRRKGGTLHPSQATGREVDAWLPPE